METYPTWIRLHPDSTDETMVTSVQARIHDPLWLLGRQWQFGELRHDGGATPIDVRIEGTSSPLTRLRGGVSAASATGSSTIKPTQAPLETLVEREAVPETGLDNLRLRTEAGLHSVRMLRAASMDGRVSFWVGESPFVAAGDRHGRRDTGLVRHGRRPRARWCGAAHVSSVPSCAPASSPPIDRRSQGPPRVDSLGGGAIRSGRRADHRRGIRNTWNTRSRRRGWARRGSGARRARVRRGPARVVRLRARRRGTLGTTGTRDSRDAPSAFPRRSISPACRTRASGRSRIPSVRFDQLELLSNPDAPPSPATLMVLDFALSYSDDWFLCRSRSTRGRSSKRPTVAITDVFGDMTTRQSARRALEPVPARRAQRAPNALAVCSSPRRRQKPIDGPPIEEVHFLATKSPTSPGRSNA